MLLDAALGEPRWIWARAPHPAVVMGQAVAWLEARLNRGGARRLKGIAALVLLCAGAVLTGTVLGLFGWPVEMIAVAVLLAQRSLVDHLRAVSDGLRMSPDAGQARCRDDRGARYRRHAAPRRGARGD